MKESLDAAKQKKEDGKGKAEERLKQAKERHLQELARIEELSETAKNQLTEDISKLQEKIDEEETEYKRKKIEVGTELAKQVGPGLTETFTTAACASVETVDSTAMKASIMDCLQKEQAKEEIPNQLQQTQMEAVATSMSAMFAQLKKELTEQLKRDMMSMAKEAEADGGDGGFTKVPNDKVGRRRAFREGAMQDTTDRPPAEKRPGEQLEEEATRNDIGRVAASTGGLQSQQGRTDEE